MNIIEMKISELKPYEKNPRLNDEAVQHVANSIEEFGFKVPIVIDSNNVIVAGHTRLKAAEKLGLCEVPVIIADDLTPQQIKAFRLADNKTAEFAQWDKQLLTSELMELKTESFDMIPFGFADEISDFGINEKESETEVIEDEYEVELPEEPKAKHGNIYQLGNHRLMCGDSTSVDDVAKLMNGVKADMVFTDPPYGMNLDTDFSGMKSKLFKGKTGCKDYMQVKGDNDDFSKALIDTIFNNFNYCTEIFIWGSDYFAELIPNRNDGSWIVWDKRANNTDDIEADYSSDKMYGSCFELCWSKKRHKRDMVRIKWAGIFGTDQEFDHKRHHPTQKPVKLSAWFLNKYSKDKENIVDLYGGSGSTLIACEQLNRKCYMMEYEAAYVDVIINRWEAFTGKKAVKL